MKIFFDLLFELIDALLIENAFADQEQLHTRDRITLGIALALHIRPIQTLVVRERVGVRTDHVRMDERWSAPAAAMRYSAYESSMAGYGVGTIHFFKVKVRKARDDA